MNAQQYADNIKQGIAGIGASAAGVGVSVIDHVEQGLQIASLCVGIAVGLVTLYNISIRKWRKK